MTQYQHLANFSSKEGYWHDRSIFRDTISDIYAKYKPQTMLEIGFNIGYSASMWLEFDPDQKLKLTSVDIGIHPDTQAAAAAVKELHGDRFEFILSDSKKIGNKLDGRLFDIIFIDGDHSAPGVYNDIQLGLKLGVPLMLFDDYHIDKPVNPIKGVCDDFEEKGKLSLIEVYHPEGIPSKVALYRNDTIHTEKNTLSRQISLLSPKSD
jgi:hypothetical protein